MSPIAALATARFPPVNPSSARAAKRSGRFAVLIPIANKTYPIDVPKMDIARIGRRPKRSDNCPRIGEAINVQNGYMA